MDICACLHECTPHVYKAYRNQKALLDLLKWVGAGNWSSVFSKSSVQYVAPEPPLQPPTVSFKIHFHAIPTPKKTSQNIQFVKVPYPNSNVGPRITGLPTARLPYSRLVTQEERFFVNPDLNTNVGRESLDGFVSKKHHLPSLEA